MNPKSYGKKCKCGHFESDHVNLNKNFYEPNVIPEMKFFFTLHLRFTIQRLSNVKDVHVITLVLKRKIGSFGNDK